MQRKVEVDLSTIELDGVDIKDYPDFADAFISYAEDYEGNELTESELEELNKDSSFVHELVLSRMF